VSTQVDLFRVHVIEHSRPVANEQAMEIIEAFELWLREQLEVWKSSSEFEEVKAGHLTFELR